MCFEVIADEAKEKKLASQRAGQLELQQSTIASHRTTCSSIGASGNACAVVIVLEASNKEAEELKHL
jgi:hypothetical protein